MLKGPLVVLLLLLLVLVLVLVQWQQQCCRLMVPLSVLQLLRSLLLHVLSHCRLLEWVLHGRLAAVPLLLLLLLVIPLALGRVVLLVLLLAVKFLQATQSSSSAMSHSCCLIRCQLHHRHHVRMSQPAQRRSAAGVVSNL
jgi:hypothetical protein